MKGSKATSIPQKNKNVLPSYEMQRLEQLKRNAEIMKAQGIGSLATQIYDKSQAFAKAFDAMNSWNDKDLFSDEDDDGEYRPQYENDSDENVSWNVKGNTQVSIILI